MAATSTTVKTSAKGQGHTPNPEPKYLDRLWNLTQETLPQVMAHTRTTLTRSETPTLLYKALQFHNKHQMESWTIQMRDHPHKVTGWTSSLDDAIQKSVPNKGITGRLSFLQRRLIRNGFETEAVTNFGAVAVINARAINVGRITRGNTENTWWLDEPMADKQIHIVWQNERGRKSKTLHDMLPHKSYASLQPLLDTDLWVGAVVVRGNPRKSHSGGESSWQKRESRIGNRLG